MKVEVGKVDTYIISDLTMEQAGILKNIFHCIGGDPEGPRRVTDELNRLIGLEGCPYYPDVVVEGSLHLDWRTEDGE